MYGFAICLSAGLFCTLLVSTLFKLSHFLWFLMALLSFTFSFLHVTVIACVLQSNQVRDHIHIWEFTFSREVCILIFFCAIIILLLEL